MSNMDTKEGHPEPPPTTSTASSQDGAPIKEPEGEGPLETVELTLSAERHKELDLKVMSMMKYHKSDSIGDKIESNRQAARLLSSIVSQSENDLQLDVTYGSLTECEDLIEEYPRVLEELQESWTKKEYARIRSLKMLQLGRPRECNPRLPKWRRWLTLSLIRHAECASNVQRDVHQRDDEPLTKYGEAQADDLGKKWANVRIDHIYSSPFPRAHETAQAIARHNSTAPVIFKNDDLKEQYLGTDVLQVPAWDRDSIYRILTGMSPYDSTLPGRAHRPGGGGESYEDVARRAQRFLHELLCIHAIPLDYDSQKPTTAETWEERHRERSVIHEKLDDRIPHIIVVSHGIFLLELYEAILFYNDYKSRHNTNYHWQNATFARLHIGRDPYDEEPLKTIIIEHPPMR